MRCGRASSSAASVCVTRSLLAEHDGHDQLSTIRQSESMNQIQSRVSAVDLSMCATPLLHSAAQATKAASTANAAHQHRSARP